jgi:type VI protein secretion system component Hcp
MAKKSKAQARKPVATKDLEPKDVKGGEGAGKVVAQDLNFVKKLDKASPVLMIGVSSS